MTKFLLLIVLAGFALLAWKTLAAIARARSAPAQRAAGDARPKPLADEPMLRCAHCGVHFPATEVVARDGQPFCSASHRDAGPRG